MPTDTAEVPVLTGPARPQPIAAALTGEEVAALRQVVCQRLKLHGIDADDLDDLCGQVISRLLLASGGPSEDARGYAVAAADRVYVDHLRQTRPNWTRLKRKLIYLLSERAGGDLFTRWKLGPQMLCGLVAWRGRPFRPTSAYNRFQSAGFRRDALDGRDPAVVPLPEIIAALFAYIGTPLTEDDLTNRVAALLSVTDSPPVRLQSIESEALHGAATALTVQDAAIEAMTTEQRCDALWPEIIALPRPQRAALLLPLTCDDLLLLAGSAGAIGSALEIAGSELLSVWKAVPMTDRDIAERLTLRTDQVSNLRKCARERLHRRLARAGME